VVPSQPAAVDDDPGTFPPLEVGSDFGDYVRTRSASLVRAAYLLTGDRQLAEDLAQTALAKVFVSWRRISRKDAAQAYATRTLVNSYLADRRRKRATEVLLGRLPDRAVPAPAPELRLVVLDALAALPPKARAVVVLRYWEDMSVEQVAALLGCSTGNVKSQSARALDKLRALLADTVPTPGPAGPRGARPAPRRIPPQPPSAQTRGAPHG
jgi:RNA polymerase sigma-70 factor (sigma-E family)